MRMLMQKTTQLAPVDQGNGQPMPDTPPVPRNTGIGSPSRKPRRWRIVKGFVIGLILVPVVGVCSYLLGLPMPGLPGSGQEEKTLSAPPPLGVRLVPAQAHTLDVPQDVRTALGIRRGKQDLVAVAQVPTRT